MTKIIDIKEFAYFLRVHRNNIIEKWLEIEEVQNIFSKHSFPVVDKNMELFYEFCDCFISVMQWNFTIEQCQIRIKFLKVLNNYSIATAELFTLVFRLKTSIEGILFHEGYLSFSLQKELDTFTINLTNELCNEYNQIQNNDENYKSEQSNLLSEYRKAVDLSNIVSKTNPKGIITYVNDKFCEISGYNRSELIGRPHNIIRHPSMERETFKELWDTIKNKKPWNGVITNMTKNGREYKVDSMIIPILDVDGDIVEYIAIRHDITELEHTKEQLQNLNKIMKNKVTELYSMTSSLEQQASIDNLTGIFNRDKFEELFTEQINKSINYDTSLSLIIFDIDHFKSINDTYGHQAGDKVLKDLVKLISTNIKTSDIFARWGGEEFAILLPETDIHGAYLFAEKLRKLIKATEFDTVRRLTASFGVGELNEYENKMTFFEKVDKSLYVAKNNGRNRVEKALLSCVN